MFASEDALKLPPPYDCYTVKPPCTLLTLLWRHPTPGLDRIDIQEESIFLGLKSDWKDEVLALHAQFPRTHHSDGTCARVTEASETRCDSSFDSDLGNDNSGDDDSDDDDYVPPSECSDEEDHYCEVDENEVDIWIRV